MRAGEIVGGLAVVGVFALIGLALIEDTDSATITTATTPTILAPAGSATPAPTTSPNASTEATQPLETEVPATTTATTTTDSPTTTLPPIPVEQVAVQVVNGSEVEGAAQFITDVLTFEGFLPNSPADAVEAVDQTTILYAPGREAAANDVNDVMEVAEELVFEDVDDVNWIEFGEELDVLVIVGPPTP